MGLDSYANKTKENWRNWWWNRFTERLCSVYAGNRIDWLTKSRYKQRRRILEDKTVLYLCGPENLDREPLLRHGFSESNIIAIDVKRKNIEAVRKTGGIGISDCLSEILVGWPTEWKIDAVAADFCCGFTDTSRSLPFALWKSAGIRSHTDTFPIVGLNLQRGRDAETNECRENIEKGREARRIFTGEADCGWQTPPLSRVGYWMDWICVEYFSFCAGRRIWPSPENPQLERDNFPVIENWIFANPQRAQAAMFVIQQFFAPSFFSYRNPNGVYMDSAVFNFPPKLFEGFIADDADFTWDQQLDFLLESDYYGGGNATTARKKAVAAKAVRTRRENGGK